MKALKGEGGKEAEKKKKKIKNFLKKDVDSKREGWYYIQALGKERKFQERVDL